MCVFYSTPRIFIYVKVKTINRYNSVPLQLFVCLEVQTSHIECDSENSRWTQRIKTTFNSFLCCFNLLLTFSIALGFFLRFFEFVFTFELFEIVSFFWLRAVRYSVDCDVFFDLLEKKIVSLPLV